MYSSALDYWYKKRHENWTKKEKVVNTNNKYTSQQLKFGMRAYLFFGIGLGVWIGYLIWG